jgi:hypothetical protein
MQSSDAIAGNLFCGFTRMDDDGRAYHDLLADGDPNESAALRLSTSSH